MSVDLSLRVARFLTRYKLTGAKLVVAVSGGPDSVCLLHLLDSLKDELGLALHVAHLDHCLRGEESAADRAYVSDLAEKMGLPATIGQADVKGLKESRKLTLEEAAREARYEFLAGVCEKVGTPYIVTGHTRNDNVETILLHIVRGSGTRGLAGLKPMTPRTIDDKELIIVRPMLDITREGTVEYCRLQNLEPRLDSSNMEMSPLRNKVRLQLLPLLQGYNSNIAGILLRLSSSAGEDLDYLDRQAAILASVLVEREGDVITLDRGGLKGVHPALKRHLMRYCLKQLPGGLKDIESRHLEDMLALLDKPSGRSIDLPYGLVFMAAYDKCWLGKADEFPCPFPPLEGEHQLAIPGVTELPGWEVEGRIVRAFDAGDDHPLTAYLDADKAGQKLVVRTSAAGDRFQPLGMDCGKKLGEFMIDSRIPKIWRANIPVVVSENGIVWLVGYRLDERYKVMSGTKRVLRLEFRRSP